MYLIPAYKHRIPLSRGGNVEWGFDAISDPPIRDDPHGHGTYIAGLIGGMNHGLCRGVNVVDVRVMGEDGYGYVHDVIAGLDYAVGKYDHIIININQHFCFNI
jgi:subtilisin family serine protease